MQESGNFKAYFFHPYFSGWKCANFSNGKTRFESLDQNTYLDAAMKANHNIDKTSWVTCFEGDIKPVYMPFLMQTTTLTRLAG
jgi:hypothetical protein